MPATTLRRALGTALTLTAVTAAPAAAHVHVHPHGHGPCRGANILPAARDMAKVRRATLCLLNVERRRYGLRPIAPSMKLRRASERHSRDMVRRRYFQHGAFVARISRTGYLRHVSFWTVGENMAYARDMVATPAEIVSLWMHSPPHRANILSHKFREVGIGVVSGTPSGKAGGTYTTDFGLRG